jgi:hypothetical protein
MRIAVVGGLVGGWILWTAEAAGAKELPVAAVEVSTRKPTAGQPFTVVMRLSAGLDMPDAGWEDFEVLIMPAARTDAEGWPRESTFWGTPVSLRRTAPGAYRGSVTVDHPGAYFAIARSAIVARRDRLNGVVAIQHAATALPVRLRVVAPPTAEAAATRPVDHSRWSAVIAGFAVAAALMTGMYGRARRTAHRVARS